MTTANGTGDSKARTLARLVTGKLLLCVAAALAMGLVFGAGSLAIKLYTLGHTFGIPLTAEFVTGLVRAIAGAWPDIVFFTAMFWALASWRLPLYVSVGILALLLLVAFVAARPDKIEDAWLGAAVFLLHLTFHLFLRLNDWFERRQARSEHP